MGLQSDRPRPATAHIATGPDILSHRDLGDRWTVLILRNACPGIRRFDAFQAPPGVTRHVLAERPGRLVEEDLLLRQTSQARPPRLEDRLTEKGRDLFPRRLALTIWADRRMDQGKGPPMRLRRRPCGHATRPQIVRPECAQPLDPGDVRALPGPGLPRKGIAAGTMPAQQCSWLASRSGQGRHPARMRLPWSTPHARPTAAAISRAAGTSMATSPNA